MVFLPPLVGPGVFPPFPALPLVETGDSDLLLFVLLGPPFLAPALPPLPPFVDTGLSALDFTPFLPLAALPPRVETGLSDLLLFGPPFLPPLALFDRPPLAPFPPLVDLSSESPPLWDLAPFLPLALPLTLLDLPLFLDS
jgi:hypothetical protein